MIDRYFASPKVIEQKRVGPLGPHGDGFATLLSEQGYARETIRCQLLLVERISKWLQRRRLCVKDLNEGIAAKFHKHPRRTYRLRLRHGELATIRLLIGHLRDSGVIPAPVQNVDDSEWGRIARKYGQYLKQEQRLSSETLNNYLPEVRRFITDRFGKGPILLRALCPADTNRFLLRHAPVYSRARIKGVITALRSFFRYLYLRGDIVTNLAVAVPKVPNWRFTTVPKWIPGEQVTRLLRSCDQATRIGQRNYAILVLLSRLGLRAGEIVAMTLDDIDWEAGEIVVRGKGNRRDRLPIPHDVGKALVQYLRKGRPRCATRRFFIRELAPHRGFRSSTAIGRIVSRALARVGLEPPFKGAHLLRHSLATETLRRGGALNEICELLRHRHPDTTQIYAKVDLGALSKLAAPWPGVVL